MATYVFSCSFTSSVSGSGTTWTDYGNVGAVDGAVARVLSLAAAGTSYNLDLTNIIPNSPGFQQIVRGNEGQFTITAIYVRIYRNCSLASSIKDSKLRRLNSGSETGNNVADTASFWPTTVASATYGGGTAFWSSFPSVTELLNGAFGMRFVVTNAHGSLASTASVDAIEVEIEMTIPDYPDFVESMDDPAIQIPALYRPQNLFEKYMRSLGYNDGSQFSNLIWLVRFSGYDEVNSVTREFNWCSGNIPEGFVTASTDDPANTLFSPVLKQAVRVNYTIVGPDRITGDNEASGGESIASNDDGQFDYLGDLDFKNKNITVIVGGIGSAYPDFFPIFEGTIQTVEVNAEEVRIVFTDRRALLNASMCPLRYAGTGGTEGPVDLKYSAKPVCIGTAFNIPAKWVDNTNHKAQIAGDFPIKAVDAVRAAGSTSGLPAYTVDLTAGIIDFASAPAGDITMDVRGWEARNAVKYGRDGTNAAWTKTNCTASAASKGVDGVLSKGTRVVATSNNATCNATGWETINWPSAIYSVYARKISGVGDVKLFGSATTIRLTTDWQRYFLVVTAPSNNFQGITIVNNGDAIEFDYYQVEPAAYYPSPPLETTTAIVYNHPNTFPAILKFILTARAGLVPFIDFDEASFTKVAAQTSAVMGLWFEEDMSVMDVVDKLRDSALFYLLMDERGRAVIGKIGVPDPAPQYVLTEYDLQATSSKRTSGARVWRTIVGFAFNHYVQQATASTISVELRERYARPWIYMIQDETAVQAIVGLSVETEMIMDTLLSSTTDAALYAAHLSGIFSKKRYILHLETGLNGIIIQPGNIVRVSMAPLTYYRNGARDYIDGIVIGKSIDSSQEFVTLEVFF